MKIVGDIKVERDGKTTVIPAGSYETTETGFKLKLDKMKPGETINLTYTAQLKNQLIGDVKDNNTVTVTSKDNTGKDIEKKAAENAYLSLRSEVAEMPNKTIEVIDEDAELPGKTGSLDFTILTEANPEIVAWIKGEGTNIDYPVLHTDNNDYYLTHLYTGEYNSSGSIFMDYRNTEIGEDKNSVIYGHHMKNGTMFNKLVNYKDPSFFEKNPTMELYTPGGDYVVELISGTVEDGNNQFVRFDFSGDEDFLRYVEGFRTRSTFKSDVKLSPDDKIISLCTCSYERDNARYMLVGRLVAAN